jgi:hypothetical protein
MTARARLTGATKADNGIVVRRDLSGDDEAEVQIHVQKIRYRHVGRRGMATLYYNSACATYAEYGQVNGQPHWSEDREVEA